MHIGEIAVWRFSLSVLRRVFSLREIRDAINEPVLPDLPASTAGYLVSNIPQECTERSIARRDGWLRYCLKSYLRCYIDMSGDFETYAAKFSSKTRSGIKRKIRKFAKESGGLDVRSYSTPSEIENFFELARPVSAASYQERLLDCGLPNDPEFIERAVNAADGGEVRAFLLFANDAPVSYLYCPIQDDALQYAYLGYDPDFAKLSPGTVLQWVAIERLFDERRFSAFDFTEGDSEHKRFFSTHQVPCSLQLFLKLTWKHRVLLSLHRFVESISVSVTQTLDRLGLKQRIKKWIRHKA
jgi:CelD/BcsL family acetyltransferase involved in cellulose biosynthesis